MRSMIPPQGANVFLQRFADQAPKNAVKMESGKGSDGRQFLQLQFIIQMLLDVYECSHDALVVILFGGRFHWRASREAQNPDSPASGSRRTTSRPPIRLREWRPRGRGNRAETAHRRLSGRRASSTSQTAARWIS